MKVYFSAFFVLAALVALGLLTTPFDTQLKEPAIGMHPYANH